MNLGKWLAVVILGCWSMGAVTGCLVSFDDFPRGNLCDPPDDPAQYANYEAWLSGDPNAPDDYARRRNCPRYLGSSVGGSSSAYPFFDAGDNGDLPEHEWLEGRARAAGDSVHVLLPSGEAGAAP